MTSGTDAADRRAMALAAITMLSWGSAGSFVRLIAGRLGDAHTIIPLAILGVRMLIAFVALLVTLAVTTPRVLRESTLPALRRGETWVTAGFQFVYYLLAVMAFMYAPIGEIALCTSTAPLFVLLIRWLRGNSVSSNQLVGAALALAGVGVIVLPNVLRHPILGSVNAYPHRALGDALSLANAGVTAAMALYQRRFTARGISVEPRALSLAAFALGLPLLWFVRGVPSVTLLSAPSIGLFLGLGLFATVLPTLAFASASRHLPPVTTATLALLLPIFATIYAALAIGEAPPLTLIPGGALVFAGLWRILQPE